MKQYFFSKGQMKKIVKKIISASPVLKIVLRKGLNLKERYWESKGRQIAALREGNSYPAIFNFIYENKYWYSDESVSGSGSTLKITSRLREQLEDLVKNKNIKKILDLPCGDHHWMKETRLEGVEYIGGDIVAGLIKKLNENNKDKNKKFIKLDIIKDGLPESDMILVRDCFIHFSNEMVSEALANIKRSSIRYMLVTHFPMCTKNLNINVGEFREINFCLPPFNFPKPVLVINEFNENELSKDKSMALWEVNSL